jgi:nitrous oxidase accessory protein NosD
MNNVFIENTADTSAGAIFVATPDPIEPNTITYNTIINNSAFLSGGAISLDYPGNESISYNHIYANEALVRGGGGIHFKDGIGAIDMFHNNIYQNTSPGTHFNIYNLDTDTTHVADYNYWGGNTTDKDLMGICDGTNSGPTCDTLDGASAGEINPTNSTTEPWPLCKDEPENEDCVGSTLRY